MRRFQRRHPLYRRNLDSSARKSPSVHLKHSSVFIAQLHLVGTNKMFVSHASIASLRARLQTTSRSSLRSAGVQQHSSRRQLTYGPAPGEGPKNLHPGAATPMHAKRGPVSWTNLGIIAVASASAVAYFKIRRERRLEEAIGKVVTSESDGWSPDRENYSPRKFTLTPEGKWMPEEDQWGGCEFVFARIGRFIVSFLAATTCLSV